MRRSTARAALGVALLFSCAAAANSAEEVQIRFQIFALAGRVSGDTDLDEGIWDGDRDEWEQVEDAVTLFDEGHFRVGRGTLRLKDDEGLFWNQEKLSFVESQKVDLPADRIRRINAPSVLLEKNKYYTIKITSKQSFQYLEKRPDGLFELKQIDDLPTGLDIRVQPKDHRGRIRFDNMDIGVRAVGRREPVPGVDLPVGVPIVEERKFKLELCVRPNTTYGVLLEMKNGQGAIVIFFTTAAVTRSALETIRREFGDVAYSIERKTRDGRPAYEVDAWIHGRHVELNVYADGALRDRRDELKLDELPTSVRDAVRKRLDVRRIDDIHKVTTPRAVTYDVDVETRGRDAEYIFADDGRLLRRHDD
jgi:hypothetical protein